MTGKIVCAVDGGETGRRAIPIAAKLARSEGTPLVLVAVDRLVLGTRGGPSHQFDSDELGKVLDDARATAEGLGATQVETVGLTGYDIAKAILDYAEGNNASHIVVGTGDKNMLTRAALGSVSHDLVVRAHCPVTVAR